MNCDQMKALHGRLKNDQWDFYNDNQGLPKDQIVNQAANQNVAGLGSQPGGPNIRYIEDPLNPNIIIDLRHLLVIGYYGRAVGESVEMMQWLNQYESGYDDQDFYSNELGYAFYAEFGSAVQYNPEGLVDYLITFLNDRTKRNSISNPERCKN